MSLNEKQLNADARHFFLGAMTGDERTTFEAAFVADEAAFDHVSSAEDELIEQYVRGMLPTNEKGLFQQHYLAVSANRERVAFTRSMIVKFSIIQKYVPATDEKASFWQAVAALFGGNRLAFGSAFAVLAVIAAGWFIVSQNSTNEVAQTVPPVETSPSPMGPTRTPQTPESNDNRQTGPDVNKPTPTPSTQNDNKPVDPRVSAPMLALFAGSVRGWGSLPHLDLPRTANGASLQLNLESRDYERYAAEVVDPDGRVVARSANLRANGKRVEMFVPTARLVSGEYTVRLSGVNKQNASESVADFPFRIIRK